MFARTAWLIFRKDLTVEVRSRETIATTLGIPPATLRPHPSDDHEAAADLDHEEDRPPSDHASLVAAISADPGLTARQRRALTEIYTAMTEATAARRSRRNG